MMKNDTRCDYTKHRTQSKTTPSIVHSQKLLSRLWFRDRIGKCSDKEIIARTLNVKLHLLLEFEKFSP